MLLCISGLLFLIFQIIPCFVCACNVTSYFYRISFPLCKALNLLFLTHRSQLAQGMMPAFSKHCFTMIVPITIGMYCTALLLMLLFRFNKDSWACEPGVGGLNYCYNINWQTPYQLSSVLGIIFMECMITIFMLYAWIKPIKSVIQRQQKQSCSMQNIRRELQSSNSQRLKYHMNRENRNNALQNSMIRGLVLTLINLVSTITIYICFGLLKQIIPWAHYLPQFDVTINIVTSFFMLQENVRYLGCAQKKKDGSETISELHKTCKSASLSLSNIVIQARNHDSSRNSVSESFAGI